MRDFLYTETFLRTVRQWNGSLLSPSPENRRVEGVEVFKNAWFEKYVATAHPIMPGVWWGPVFGYCVYRTISDARIGLPMALFMFVVGFVAWTLIEYLLHRYVFHLEPKPTFESKLQRFMVHGYHHEFPNHRQRLVAPLLLSFPIGVVVALGYFLLFGADHWWMVFGGTLIGYLTYDWVHYYTHHFRPTTRLGKFLRRYHMEHHYKDSQSHFGISSPLWDWVFGTAKGTANATDESLPGLAERH